MINITTTLILYYYYFYFNTLYLFHFNKLLLILFVHFFLFLILCFNYCFSSIEIIIKHIQLKMITRVKLLIIDQFCSIVFSLIAIFESIKKYIIFLSLSLSLSSWNSFHNLFISFFMIIIYYFITFIVNENLYFKILFLSFKCFKCVTCFCCYF